MPFYRFEELEHVNLTPHLSTARSPIIEGKYLYYCLNQKVAGTGSELHYHPNELLVFVVEGKVNCVIGKDRRIINPGTFVLIPPYVRHSLKATEEGPCAYLYVKDQTWTVVGLAADEAEPDEAMSVEEVNKLYEAGQIEDRKGQNTGGDGSGEDSKIIIENVPECYYSILRSLEDPFRAGLRIDWIEGEREAFGFHEIPSGYSEISQSSPHEQYVYVLQGMVDAQVGNDKKQAQKGDIIEIPKGIAYKFDISPDHPTRYVTIRSTEFLEAKIS